MLKESIDELIAKRIDLMREESFKEREFTISDRSGKGKFADMLGDASRWKDEVESFGGGLRPDSPAKTSRPPSLRGTPNTGRDECLDL